MREITGDIWAHQAPNTVIVIPTNGIVTRRSDCVMGRGLALQAKQKYPLLPSKLGACIVEKGNVPHYFCDWSLMTFPVKHHWKDKADLDLIEQSARRLRVHAVIMQSYNFYMPRVGCGNGGLKWEDVKPILQRHLMDLVRIVDHHA